MQPAAGKSLYNSWRDFVQRGKAEMLRARGPYAKICTFSLFR